MVNKEHSQVVFFPRGEEEVEAMVFGGMDIHTGKLEITRITDMDLNPIEVSPEEKELAASCLFDYINSDEE